MPKVRCATGMLSRSKDRASSKSLAWINESAKLLASIIVFYEPYLARVVAAGSFRSYAKNHITALVATFAPKFSHLPDDLVGVVMMFYAHVGCY